MLIFYLLFVSACNSIFTRPKFSIIPYAQDQRTLRGIYVFLLSLFLFTLFLNV